MLQINRNNLYFQMIVLQTGIVNNQCIQVLFHNLTDTKILGITVKDGICYLNLSEDFLTVVYPVTEDVILYSLVNSLTELPNVNKVQISIDGNTERYFGDHINLESLYERNLELLNPQETVR